MKFSCIFLCFIVSASLRLYFQDATTHAFSTSPPVYFPSTTRSITEGSTSRRLLRTYPSIKFKIEKTEVLEEETHKSYNQGQQSAGYNNDDDLIYHIDYNGVTTHPTPTKKHHRP